MKDVYKDRYGEDISDDSVKTLYSLAVSIFAIGGMVGGFSGGTIANRFGRSVSDISDITLASHDFNKRPFPNYNTVVLLSSDYNTRVFFFRDLIFNRSF